MGTGTFKTVEELSGDGRFCQVPVLVKYQGDESGMIFVIGFLQRFSLMQPFIAIVLESEKIDDGAAAATVLQNSESIVDREKRSKWTSTAVPLSSVFKSVRVIILLNQYFILLLLLNPRNGRASL
ncbi:hypothetical protein OIU76_028141 [Salix suchowensis]|nr:hypothetical protein OIU76_028141 [Salix suchowensis]